MGFGSVSLLEYQFAVKCYRLELESAPSNYRFKIITSAQAGGPNKDAFRKSWELYSKMTSYLFLGSLSPYALTGLHTHRFYKAMVHVHTR